MVQAVTPLAWRRGLGSRLRGAGEASLLIPFAVLLGLILVPPFLFVVLTSFGEHGWSLSSYKDILTQPLFQRVLRNTIEIGFFSAVISVTMGYFVALHLSRCSPRRRAVYITMVMLPFWTSILVKSFAFTVILGTNGIINNAIATVLGDSYKLPMLFNRVGVYIGLSHWLLPFAVFPILSALRAQDPNLPIAAEVMGASRFRIFWSIVFPQTMPAVIAGAIMVGVIAMGSFVTPSLLGGRGDLMMANMVDFYIREALDWPMACAIAVTLLVLAGLVIVLQKLIGGLYRMARG